MFGRRVGRRMRWSRAGETFCHGSTGEHIFMFVGRTAVSSGEVNPRISVHRLEQRMVPRFCWLDLRLQASLYSMYGLPVSTCGDTAAAAVASAGGTATFHSPAA